MPWTFSDDLHNTSVCNLNNFVIITNSDEGWILTIKLHHPSKNGTTAVQQGPCPKTHANSLITDPGHQILENNIFLALNNNCCHILIIINAKKIGFKRNNLMFLQLTPIEFSYHTFVSNSYHFQIILAQSQSLRHCIIHLVNSCAT